MKAAIITISGMYGRNMYLFKGEEYSNIIDSLNYVQDLGCLARMGQSMGTASDKKEVKKIEKFLDKYYSNELTREDMMGFRYNLSVGSFFIVELAETDEEVEKLISNYPAAIER